MPNYNRVILAGNLTRDPQLSYLPSQTPVCEFGIAINRRWRGTNGEQREETCFIDCRLFGKLAETFNQYMAKGRPVLVEGRLQLDTWEGKDGKRHSKHRIFVQNFQFLGDHRDPSGPPPRPPTSPPAKEPAKEPAVPMIEEPDMGQGPEGDTIPF